MRLFIHLTSVAAMTLLAANAAPAEPRIDASAQALPEPARKTLDRIPDQGRKLLALRSYLRSTRSMEMRWSWTKAEIDAYLKTDQYVTAMAAVAAVVKAFEVKNPGYTLLVNTDIRSLDEQIEKWNSNGSVQAAGSEINAASTKWLADNPKAGPEQLRAFLVDWKPATTSMLAAPGLTAHGRGEAFDFQIMKDKAVVAGADGGAISREWQGNGWSAKLAEAVKLSTMPFEGPLSDPNEPWHYDYNPPARDKLVVAEVEPATEPPKPPASSPPETPVAPETAKAPANPPPEAPIPQEAPAAPEAKTAPATAETPPVVAAIPTPAPRSGAQAAPETQKAASTQRAKRAEKRVERKAKRQKRPAKRYKKPRRWWNGIVR